MKIHERFERKKELSAEQKDELKNEIENLERLRDRWGKSDKSKKLYQKQYSTDWVSPIFSTINEINSYLNNEEIKRKRAGFLAAWRRGVKNEMSLQPKLGAKIQDFCDEVIEKAQKYIS